MMPRGKHRPDRSRGFTLFELLVVMVLIGLGVTLAAASIDRFAMRQQELRWFDRAQHELLRLRNRAILGGEIVRAEVNFVSGELVRVSPSGDRQLILALPAGFVFSPWRVGGEAPATTEPESSLLFFFPDGSAADARFAMSSPGDRQSVFRVIGVTGKIEKIDVPKG